MTNNSDTPMGVGTSAGLGQTDPERAAFDLHDCAMGYAYTESTDPTGPDDWSTDDVVKAFKSGYELAQRHALADVAAERERLLAALTRHDWQRASIWRLYYPSATGDWVDLRELRKALGA